MRIPRVLIPLGIVAAAAVGALAPGAATAQYQKTQGDKVTLCHATSSRTNPYVVITVAKDSVFKKGHDVHQDGRDIIPPFDYVGGNGATQHYPGKNWDAEGRAWLANDCEPVNPPDPGPDPEPSGDDPTVTICHWGGGNVYVREELPGMTVRTVHDGRHPMDIIPPYQYRPSGGDLEDADGQNWDAGGQAAFANGCIPADPGPGPDPDPRTLDSPVGVSVTCVRDNGDGTYDALYGYDNPNGHDVNLPAGDLNAVVNEPGDPGAVDRGQPHDFGTTPVPAAFAVRDIPNARTVTWRVTYMGTVDAVAGRAFPVDCGSGPPTPDDPDGPPTPPSPDQPNPVAGKVGVYVTCVTPNKAGTRFSATFGYVNPGGSDIQVPVGDGNEVTGAGAADRGQPIRFVSGSVASAFTVTGIKATGAARWSVRMPSGETASATATITGGSCAVDAVDQDRPNLGTKVRAPRRTQVNTRTRWSVVVDNNWQEPAYDVEVDVPTPGTEDDPTRIAARGITCPASATSGTTTCTTPMLLPGMSPRIRFTTYSRRVGGTLVRSRAGGLSLAGVGVLAADSTPMLVVGRRPAVTG